MESYNILQVSSGELKVNLALLNTESSVSIPVFLPDAFCVIDSMTFDGTGRVSSEAELHANSKFRPSQITVGGDESISSSVRASHGAS